MEIICTKSRENNKAARLVAIFVSSIDLRPRGSNHLSLTSGRVHALYAHIGLFTNCVHQVNRALDRQCPIQFDTDLAKPIQ